MKIEKVKSKMLTTQDLQMVLGIGRNSAYRLMKESDFPSVKIYGRYLVDSGELENWKKRKAYQCKT